MHLQEGYLTTKPREILSHNNRSLATDAVSCFVWLPIWDQLSSYFGPVTDFAASCVRIKQDQLFQV
jgi:hypothetical protein